MQSTIPADLMHYNYVARAIVGGYTGLAGSLPSDIIAGETYSQDFFYNVPTDYDVAKMKAIILLIDNQSGAILNGAKQELLFNGINLVSSDVAEVGVYPNPINELINVDVSLGAPQNVSIELMDVSGRVLMQQNQGKLSKGFHQAQIRTESFPAGIYMLTFFTDSGTLTLKVVKP